MVSSSKGKPTDPKLKEKVTEEVKNETNKDGGGKGQMSAWKVSTSGAKTDIVQAAKIAKEYEKKGGDYENEAGSKNEPKKGEPEHKSPSKKETEEKNKDKGTDEAADDKADGKAQETNKSKSKTPNKSTARAKGTAKPRKEKAAPREGERRSTRVAQQKRSAPADEKKPTKKAKTGSG